MTLLLVLDLVVFLVDFVVRCHDSFLNKVLDSRFIDIKLSRGALGQRGPDASHLPVFVFHVDDDMISIALPPANIHAVHLSLCR